MDFVSVISVLLLVTALIPAAVAAYLVTLFVPILLVMGLQAF